MELTDLFVYSLHIGIGPIDVRELDTFSRLSVLVC